MRVFKINYEMQGNKSFTAGILAENKDKALKFLKKTVGTIKRINSISSSDTDVHGIDDEIVKRILKKYDKVEVVKEEKSEDRETKELQKKVDFLDKEKKEITAEKDRKLAEKDAYIKQLNNDINNLTAQLETLRVDGVKETIFVCDICDSEFKSKVGMKQHKTRVHKDN